ncbi:RHS repeat domain-containing protein [Pseudomonas koreensis]|uniref:Rhs n=1 Tax=Pseudomonas koreensis TaxID=198620 RepID=A0AA94EMU8_9PSED|nr:RHS repeat-associated core domain-containing protein [Pseudomonas koreensis]RVD77125.1 Rhs [Pseudomonas koreensis]
MSKGIHARTPTVNAIDSRGLSVRHIDYYRCKAEERAQARITSSHHDTAARCSQQWDAGQTNTSMPPGLTSIKSFSGQVLRLHSADAGWRLSFPGEAGQLLEQWDSLGGHWKTAFDHQLRPVSITQASPQQPARVIERLSYGDNSPACAALNQCGELIRHDDDAGTLLIEEYTFGSQPVRQTRHFLCSETPVDWPLEQAQRNLLHEAGPGYQTHWRYDADGAVIRQTDAGHHQHCFAFDVAGQLKSVSLKLNASLEEITLAKAFVYNAAGQLESQTSGNGVISNATFDPANGRLRSLTATASGTTLQDLHYQYDAVGNVMQIEDKAQSARFGNNQKVEAISRFTYDSLSRLTRASGREAASHLAPLQLATSPAIPIDASQLFNYTRHYDYDSRGNLIKLQHVREGHQYTRTLSIAGDSNRMLSWNQGDNRPDAAATFDANGNLQNLQPGKSLQWNPRNQLSSVVLVQREDGRNDHERYHYDSSGQRVRKIHTTYTSSVTHNREVRYLPGIEINSSTGQRLETINIQTGRGTVRCLHWREGQPAGIETDQLRYNLEDHLGSSTLELDNQALLISQEEYFPFGGTAWSASRSAVQARYRTLRYCGKERDASGLYYYGARYYAPWLQRWISPDPAGAIDGLNLYVMVGNNPLRYTDRHGNQKEESSLRQELATYPSILSEVNKRVGTLNYQLYNSTRKRDIIKRLFQRYAYNAGRHILALGAGLLALPTGPGGAVIATVATSLSIDAAAGKAEATRHLTVALYPQTRRLDPEEIKHEGQTAFYNVTAKLQYAKDVTLNPRSETGQKNLSVMATGFLLTKVLEVKGAWIPNFEASTQATKALDGLPGQKIERMNNALARLDDFLEQDSHAINAAFDALGVDEFYPEGLKGRLGQATDRAADAVGVDSSNLISRTSLQRDIAVSRATIQRGRELLFRHNERNKSQGRFFV